MPHPAGSTHGCLAGSPHPVSAGRRRSSRRGASPSCFLTSPCTSSVVKRSWAPILPPLHRFTPLAGLQEEEFLCWKPRRNGGPRSAPFPSHRLQHECCRHNRGPRGFVIPSVLFMFFLLTPLCAHGFDSRFVSGFFCLRAQMSRRVGVSAAMGRVAGPNGVVAGG